MWWILAASQQGNSEMQHYLQVQEATGMVWVGPLTLATRLRVYLIIRCNHFCNSMKNTSSHELVGTYYVFEIQTLLYFLFGLHSLFLQFLLCLHNPSDLLWNCPVINWYVHFLAPLFVKLGMLTKMQMTRGVPALVKCLVLSIHLNEVLIKPGPFW